MLRQLLAFDPHARAVIPAAHPGIKRLHIPLCTFTKVYTSPYTNIRLCMSRYAYVYDLMYLGVHKPREYQNNTLLSPVPCPRAELLARFSRIFVS